MKLKLQGFKSKVDISNLTLNKKIRNSQVDQTSYILVVGESEVSSETVHVRTREGKQLGEFTIPDLINKLKAEEIS